MSYRVSLTEEVRETLFFLICPSRISRILSVMNKNTLTEKELELVETILTEWLDERYENWEEMSENEKSKWSEIFDIVKA